MVPGVLVVDIGVAQNLLHRPDEISRLLVGTDKGPHAPFESIADDRLRLMPANSETDLERLTDSFHLNLTAFGLLSFFVGLFIVNSAVGLAFEQRLPMLRTLRACGVSARKLNVVLVLELIMLALLAGLIGLVCGYLIAAALLPDVAASLRGLYGAEIPGELTLKPRWWFAGLAISIIGALVAATASLLKAMRLSVLATAQPQAWKQAQHRWLILQAASAVAVFAAAALLFWFGDSLLSGFAVLAALLLGAALILPAILEMVLSLGQRSTRQALASWFWADSRQQLSGLSLALRALFLALAVNVGVGTMVETFSRTFATWLDGRLAADIYINAADNAQADDIKAWLRGRPEVEAILPGGRAETQLDGAPIEIVGLPDNSIYRDHWALLQSVANAWVRLRPGEAGFVSEQLARRLNLKLGDRIELPAPGGIWTLEIAGIYADYGNPKGEITVNIAALLRHFPAIPQTRMGLRVVPAQIPALMTTLQTRYGLDGRNLLDQATLKADLTRNLQPDVCGYRGAECLHTRHCRHRSVDEPFDPGQFPPAATRAVVGDRHYPNASRVDRVTEDHVGGAAHNLAGAATGIMRGVVPDRGSQCEGIRLAIAVRRVPAATDRTGCRGNACRIGRGADSGDKTGAHATGQPDQDFRR